MPNSIYKSPVTFGAYGSSLGFTIPVRGLAAQVCGTGPGQKATLEIKVSGDQCIAIIKWKPTVAGK